jgi:hypothetical protein
MISCKKIVADENYFGSDCALYGIRISVSERCPLWNPISVSESSQAVIFRRCVYKENP